MAAKEHLRLNCLLKFLKGKLATPLGAHKGQGGARERRRQKYRIYDLYVALCCASLRSASLFSARTSFGTRQKRVFLSRRLLSARRARRLIFARSLCIRVNSLEKVDAKRRWNRSQVLAALHLRRRTEGLRGTRVVEIIYGIVTRA